MIAGVQQRFPDFRFTLIGEPNGYGDNVRFSWGLGPEGVDSPIKGTDFGGDAGMAGSKASRDFWTRCRRVEGRDGVERSETHRLLCQY